jgi:hypothetical protein
MAKKQDKGRAVVVTTEHRGVFFGYATESGSTMTLKEARMCLYWSADVKGVLGLAVTGPNKSCRIGPAVPSLRLDKVTAVAEATPEAEAAWLKGFWS